MPRVTIIGTGLVGASLGLALKKANIRDLEVIGHDAEPNHNTRAHRMGAVDRAVANLPNAVEGAHIVVLAIPLKDMADEMAYIAPHLSKGTIVMDVASVKQPVMQAAKEKLPEGVSFIGGDPLVYKEGRGPDAAEATLFAGKTFCIVPSTTADADAPRTVASLVTAIGAKPYFIDAAEHDALTAGVSTLPVMLAMTLAGMVSKSPSWSDIAQLASGLYRKGADLASVEALAAVDLAMADPGSTVHWIDETIAALYDLRNLVQKGERDKVQAEFIRAWEQHQRWLAGKVEAGRRAAGPELPKASDSFAEMLMGRKLLDYQKKMMRDIERREKGPSRKADGR